MRRHKSLFVLRSIRVAMRQATAPFRGYGMERIPFLRQAYATTYPLICRTGTREISTSGMRLTVDFSDRSIVPSMWLLRVYEPTLTRSIRAILRPGMTVIDVGAHFGYYTVLFGKATGATGNVIAYEPCTAMRALLESNLISNRVSAQSCVRSVGVADSPARMQPLWLSAHNSGGASVVRSNVEAVVGSEEVQLVALDAERESGTISETVDLIKIDVQGFEERVLLGASGLVRSDRPILVFELNPAQISRAGDSADRLLGQLTDWGYHLFAVDERKGVLIPSDPGVLLKTCLTEKDDGTGYYNVIGVHSQHLGTLSPVLEAIG